MPLYDFKCGEGHTFELMVPLKDFEVVQHCACGGPAQRVITAPMFTVDQTGYSCPVTGKWVGSKREHSENLKQQGCRVLETGEKEQNLARAAKEEAEFEKKVEATVEREVSAMPSEKREKLYAEMTRGGADVTYERRTI